MPSERRRSDLRVDLQDASRAIDVPSRTRFRKWVAAAVAGPARVTIRLVGAAEGRRLNLAYRGKDYATNVLTFAYEDGLGDIVLCPSVIAREAREQGKPIGAHYAHLTVHAILHLRGYDHESAKDAARMERTEIRILRALGHANPYVTGA